MLKIIFIITVLSVTGIVFPRGKMNQPDDSVAVVIAHYWDHFNTHDSSMVSSDVLSVKISGYLFLFFNQDFSKGQMEKAYRDAADSILNKVKSNRFIYEKSLAILIDNFTHYKFDHAINYLIENYVIKDDVCLDDNSELLISNRLEQIKRFKRGSLVPDISIPGTDGNNIELDKLNSGMLLIVFYASWCPHCKELIPQLNVMYKNQQETKTNVLAISIDTNKTAWLSFIKKNELNWVNACDLMGWNGKAVRDYFIYATPSMFIINNKKELISKPETIKELKNYFR
jgi:peroxiredoxin